MPLAGVDEEAVHQIPNGRQHGQPVLVAVVEVDWNSRAAATALPKMAGHAIICSKTVISDPHYRRRGWHTRRYSQRGSKA